MSLRLGSAFGIPIFVHWTFFLLPLWIAYMHPADALFGVGVMLAAVPPLFLCVVLHEFGHALMARRFGIDTADVTLYPIGGVARLKRMAEKPLEEFLIAIAGPAVNVLLAIPMFCVFVVLFVVDPSLELLFGLTGSFFGQVALVVFALNLIMVPFNLLPAFPMDGGRLLRAVLASWLGHYQGTRIAVIVGIGMAILMGIVGILGQSLLPIIALFIVLAGRQELWIAKLREQRRLRWEEEEPLEAVPARPKEEIFVQVPPLPISMLQPKVAVFTWDHQTGTWRQEPSTPA